MSLRRHGAATLKYDRSEGVDISLLGGNRVLGSYLEGESNTGAMNVNVPPSGVKPDDTRLR